MEGTVQRYTGITTTGALASFAASAQPFATYAISVKGASAAPSSWSVTLEGSLDNANWTVITTHNATDGSTVWETNGKPVLFARANVGALSIGSAVSIAVTVVAVP